MVSPEFFVRTLQNNGINFFAGVPDSLLKNVCAYITDNIDNDHNLITANEGAAIGVAAGYYLATGKVPLVYMQNSGIGNAVNPLLSLTDEKVYSIPVILMIGWRGEPGVHDEPQHAKQGAIMLDLLKVMEIPYYIVPDEDSSAQKVIETVVKNCRQNKRPYALIVKKGIFGLYNLKIKIPNNYPISREDALRAVVDMLPENSVIVSTTGKLSRELYEYRDIKLKSHRSDFLTVGSMGHASSIALGIALEKKNRKVICLDGDGAFIMHMGAISNIGQLAPANYIHVLFNNGAHESVGAQPTLGFNMDIPAIAKACGYRNVKSVYNKEEIGPALEEMLCSYGPSFLEIRVCINSRDDLGRPKTTPIENKENLMNFIQS